MPVLWICWQVAPVGQVPPCPPPPPQMRAQLVGEEEPWDSRTHCGMAVEPAGADGQAATCVVCSNHVRPHECEGHIRSCRDALIKFSYKKRRKVRAPG